jgi:hypothetical protein
LVALVGQFVRDLRLGALEMIVEPIESVRAALHRAADQIESSRERLDEEARASAADPLD